MRCVIPGSHVKLFGKSVQCLSKIGSELYLEASEDSLALRTVNSSRSAFGCVTFHRSFFHEYDNDAASLPARNGRHAGDGGSEGEADELEVKCKVGAKSCLSVFRSLATLEKTVDRCCINLDLLLSKLVFILYCKHGITKTYNLGFQECESLQAVFSKDLSVNVITAPSKLLQDVVANFQVSQEEITMRAAASHLTFKNYVDDAPDPKKALLTETSLDPEDFEHYCIGVETSLTFCLKELRAILSFLDAAQQDLTMHFESGGKPMVFCVDRDVSYTADFVMATLMESLAAAATTTTDVDGGATLAESGALRNDLPPATASQAQNTQNNTTAISRDNNVPSVPGRLTTVRAQKRRSVSSDPTTSSDAQHPATAVYSGRRGTAASSEVEWPDEGFPKRVRRPYDDSQQSLRHSRSAMSPSICTPGTPRLRQSSNAASGVAAAATAMRGDYDPFSAPLVDDFDVPVADDEPASEVPSSHDDGCLGNVDSGLAPMVASEALVDETPPGYRKHPPSSWLQSQERDNFNPLETPTSGVPKFSLSESSDYTSSSMGHTDVDVVLNSPGVTGNHSKSMRTPTSHVFGAGARPATTSSIAATASESSVSMVAMTPQRSVTFASERDLSMAVVDDDNDGDMTMDMSEDAVVERTALSTTMSVGMISPMVTGGRAGNSVIGRAGGPSPNTRQFCALFFGAIPDNFAEEPTGGTEEVLAEDTDDEC